jgi:serine/threonine protein kinase
MPLPIGARLGPYQIESALGAGGMGEVYKARDTRLERTVAIKALPPQLAGDLQFRERFACEAKSISQLTHPNICTVHDIGQAAGPGSKAEAIHFLVLECLEGETLATRLGRGAVPLDDALKIACDIASALDKAHRHE